MKLTRQDYLANKCTHREYYAQWVTHSIKALVIGSIGLKRLLKAKDEHLNDIPLKEWDQLTIFVHSDDGSLASKVCLLKEAARQIIEDV